MRGCTSPWKPTNEGDQLGKRLVIIYRQAPLFIEKLIDVPYMVSETNPLIILINVFYIYENGLAGNLPSIYA